MSATGDSLNRGRGRWHRRGANLEALVVLALLALAAWAAPLAGAAPQATRTVYAQGRIVPIPASIPHEEGDMVDRRVLPDLRWIADRYPIYVTDGYSGPLPGGGHAGCDRCHARNSDHHNGLAVDIVPAGGGARCDRSWDPISRLARWAEPLQNRPVPPFRWVGYDGDAGHGCGHHLHLSWNHAEVREFRLAEWVEVLPPRPKGPNPKLPSPPVDPVPGPAPEPAKRPSGGISMVETGGVAPRRK